MELYGETFDDFCLRMSALSTAIKDPLFEFESALEMYIFAKENLEEATLNHAFEIREAYADIPHTRVVYDSLQEKMYSQSPNIENYAINIIDRKESHKKEKAALQYYLDLFNSACEILSEDERELLRTYKAGTITESSPELTHLMTKLREEIERLMDLVEILKAIRILAHGR